MDFYDLNKLFLLLLTRFPWHKRNGLRNCVHLCCAGYLAHPLDFFGFYAGFSIRESPFSLCRLQRSSAYIMKETDSLSDTSGQKWTFVSTLTKFAINSLTVSVSPHKMSPVQALSFILLFWISRRNIASLVLVFFEKACDLRT